MYIYVYVCKSPVGEKLTRLTRLRGLMLRHVVPQTNSGSQKFRKNQVPQKSIKSMPCVYYNDNSCNFNKNHETKGVFYRHICSSCFAQGQCPQCPGLQTKMSKKRVTLGMVNAAQLQPDYVQDQVPEEKFSSQYSCRYIYIYITLLLNRVFLSMNL